MHKNTLDAVATITNRRPTSLARENATNTTFACALLLAITLVAGSKTDAQETGFLLPSSTTTTSVEPPAFQQAVLLTNGNVFQGDVKELGDQIRVSRKNGSVINLHRNQVATIAPTINHLYRQRIQGRFAGDLTKFQSDARWCLRNGLLREAAADVLHAKSIDPTNATTLQLLGQIAAQFRRQSAESNQPMTMPAVRTVSHETIAIPATSDSRDLETETEESNRLPSEIAIEFRTKIQPILHNRCANCHSMESDREFKLHSATKSRLGGKWITDENLAAVMNFIDLNAPTNSVFRHRATDQHGGRTNSFGNDKSAMLRNLDRWLSKLPSSSSKTLTALTGHEIANRHMDNRTQRLAPTSPPQLSPLGYGSSTEQPFVNSATETRPVWKSDSNTDTTNQPKTFSETDTRRVRRTPTVKNPFDPEIFNRKFHGSDSQ